MPQVRLMGLVLLITAIFLAMAAAATQTTHIRFNPPWRARAAAEAELQKGFPPDPILSNQPIWDDESLDRESSSALPFVAVPVAYPLLLAGVIGFLLWFAPASVVRSSSKRSRRRRGRR